MADFEPALQNAVFRYLHSWVSDVKAAAMRYAPVRTGFLRSSIYGVVSDWVAVIGAEATYAMFVEMGTRRMMAQPFINPAIQEYLPNLEVIICEAIELKSH